MRKHVRNAFAATLFLATLPSFSETIIELRLVDATTGRRVGFGESRAEVNGRELKSTVSGARITLALPDGIEPVQFGLQAGDEYVNRNVAVSSDKLAGRSSITFGVDKSPKRFTDSYLQSGRQRLDRKDFDGALALFEIAATRDDKRNPNADLDGYEAMLRFNYARSLQQTCIQLGYVTCDLALEHLANILDEMKYTSREKTYESYGVTRSMVVAATEQINSLKIKRQYQDAISQVNSGDVKVGKRSLEELAANRSANASRFAAISLTEKRLKSDLDFASTVLKEKTSTSSGR